MGLHQRIGAWEDHHGLKVPDDMLRIASGPVNLLNPTEVAELCAKLTGMRSPLSTPWGGPSSAPMRTPLETWASRSTRYTASATPLETERSWSCITHPRATAPRGRGSSAFEDGIDTLYIAEGDYRNVTLTRAKRKDGPQDDVVTGYLNITGMSGLFADKLSA
jgi:hypothetical protein